MDLCDEEIGICTQDEEKLVNEMVKAVLILDHSKRPFKLTDILKFLSKKPNRKQYVAALEKCKIKLKELGLMFLECKNSNAKSLILVSNILPLPSMYRDAEESEVADRTLLVLVLTYIFMKEGIVTDADVLNHLQELNIYSEKMPVHDYFGDIKKKVLKEFVSQLYLERLIGKDSETAELKWGERAHAEVNKQSILKFVCEIGYEGTIQPKNLASHYQAALKENKRSCETYDNEVMEVDE